MEKIGLIAGNRKFPLLFAEEAKKNNLFIVAVAIKGESSSKLKKLVDKIYWLGLSDFRRILEIFRSEGIKKIVMAGQVSPWRLFSKEVNQSEELKNLLKDMRDRKANTIFAAAAAILENSGFELINSTTFLEEFLPKKGVLTKKGPDFAGWEDIYFGWELARTVAYLDIGQTVAVKNKAIVAVEALEGTDSLIRRASALSRGGFVLVKVSRPKQDMRFDIPVVGLTTVRNLIKTAAACLAIEAGKTLFIDKDKSVRLADKRGLAIVAV